MAYNLPYGYPAGSTLPIQDTLTATIAGITLPGKNFLGYGEIVDQALLNMTEHFASSSAGGAGPSNPIMGQIWYDASTDTLKYRTNTNVWTDLATVGGSSPSANIGTANIGNLISANASITGGNITGLTNLQAANGNIANLTSANANISGGNVTGLANLTAANGNIANLTSANANISGGNVTGLANLQATNGNIVNLTSGNANISGGNVTGLANLTAANGNIANLTSANANISGGNVTGLANLTATNGNITNLTSGNANITGGNISGNIGGTLFYKVTFDASGAGIANAPGNIYDAASNIVVSWNTVGAAAGNATGWANVGLTAPVANVKIAGGTSGQVLSTDGAGTLSWTSVGGSAATLTSITTGAVGTAGTLTGQWTLTAGSTLEATYADLAERHHSDAEYPVGTVMTVGGANEVTACQVSQTALGVVSDQYAYLMNAEAGPDETHPAVGYLGRVPVRVVGPVMKHQRIAPAGNGQAAAADKNSFGWALETNTDVAEKLVLCIIK